LKHPFRDSAILYAVLALVIVGVTAVTGGDIGTAAAVALGFFFVATAWSWWRFKTRLDAEGRR
jgi:hypothetical protein